MDTCELKLFCWKTSPENEALQEQCFQVKQAEAGQASAPPLLHFCPRLCCVYLRDVSTHLCSVIVCVFFTHVINARCCYPPNPKP